ncbi:MAG: hypothetical protein ABL970_12415 [Nitrospira sp.]
MSIHDLFANPSNPWGMMLSGYLSALGDEARADVRSRVQRAAEAECACPAGSPAWTAMVRAQGFTPLPSLVTAEFTAASSFIEQAGDAVYLSVQGQDGGGLVLSREEARATVGALLLRGAVLITQVPSGCVCSVYFVEGQIVATVVKSWRSGDVRPASLDCGFVTVERCGELVRAFGLVFAEVLLVMEAGGEVGCLDVVARPNYWNCPKDVHRRVIGRLRRCVVHHESLSTAGMA